MPKKATAAAAVVAGGLSQKIKPKMDRLDNW